MGLRSFWGAFLTLMVANTTAEGSCACQALEAVVREQNTELEQQKGELKQQKGDMQEMRQRQDEMQAQLLALLQEREQEPVSAAATSTTASVRVAASGATSHADALEPRRLSAGGSGGFSIGVRPWLAPAFPDGHSCSNLDSGRPIHLLPVTNESSVTWNPSPSNLPSEANMSLVSVGKGWITSQVQTFPAPFTIRHDAGCQQTPTLELGLSTTVPSLAPSGVICSVAQKSEATHRRRAAMSMDAPVACAGTGPTLCRPLAAIRYMASGASRTMATLASTPMGIAPQPHGRAEMVV